MQTFESDEDFDEIEEDAESTEEPETEPEYRQRAKRGSSDVPDSAVANAADIPLLPHSGTSKSNTVTYLKIIRLDGGQGVRGLKGKLPPSSTYEDVARRFGNGTYKIEGCNQRHKRLAVEEALEIAIPGFDNVDPQQTPVPTPVGVNNGAYALHGMKMIADMSRGHESAIREQAGSSNEQVRDMATQTMQMLTTFTSAQRDSDRESHTTALAHQQQFFATMMAAQSQAHSQQMQMQTQAHAQQMEVLNAMREHERKSEVDPMAMIRVFMDGLKAGGELGGNDTPEWVQALNAGTGMMGHLAQIATSPNVRGALAQGTAPAALPKPVTPSQPATPQAAPQADGGQRRRTRLPFDKNELRELARLKATLRKRGIPLADFAGQTTQYYETAPESEIFESGDEGPETSDHAETSSADAPTHETS